MNLLLRNWQPFSNKLSTATARVTIFPEKIVPQDQGADHSWHTGRNVVDSNKAKEQLDMSSPDLYEPGVYYLQENQNQPIENYGRELSWPTVAPHIMLEGYQYLEPINRAQLAKDKLQSYEQSLNLTFQKHFEPRIYGENHIRKRQAELFLHRMGPLTQTYLKQGVNFLSAHVFAKLIENGKMSILKDMLNGGAFETANFVKKEFLRDFLPEFIDNPRNQFLLNILCYEHTTIVQTDKIPAFQEDQQGNPIESEDEEGIQKTQNAVEDQEIMTDEALPTRSIADQVIFGKALSQILKNHRDYNRLRLFWSFQKVYLPHEDLFDHIFEELNHLTFKVDPSQQAEVTREVKYILNSAYSSSSFDSFLTSLVAMFDTFHEFITGYTISIIILSKLRAIKRLIPESKSYELNPVFDLMKNNLHRDQWRDLIDMLVEMLSHEDHSRIEFENFKRSFEFWDESQSQPIKTTYHSALSRLIEDNQEPIEILYQRDPSQQAYAKFTHKLIREKKLPPLKTYFGQSEMIKHIMKKDYQPVLDHFITSFNFTSERGHSNRLAEEMKNADKNLAFKSNNESALYKLKAAHNIFFNQSLPEPLSHEQLEPHKDAYNAMVSVSKELISDEDHMMQYKLLSKYDIFLSAYHAQKVHVVENSNEGQKMVEAETQTEVEAGGQQPVEVTTEPQAEPEVPAEEVAPQQVQAEPVAEGEAEPELVDAEYGENEEQSSTKIKELNEEQKRELEATQALLNALFFGSEDYYISRQVDNPRSWKGIETYINEFNQREAQSESYSIEYDSENIYELYVDTHLESRLALEPDEDTQAATRKAEKEKSKQLFQKYRKKLKQLSTLRREKNVVIMNPKHVREMLKQVQNQSRMNKIHRFYLRKKAMQAIEQLKSISGRDFSEFVQDLDHFEKIDSPDLLAISEFMKEKDPSEIEEAVKFINKKKAKLQELGQSLKLGFLNASQLQAITKKDSKISNKFIRALIGIQVIKASNTLAAKRLQLGMINDPNPIDPDFSAILLINEHLMHKRIPIELQSEETESKKNKKKEVPPEGSDAEKINAEEPKTEKVNAEEQTTEKMNAEEQSIEKINTEEYGTEEQVTEELNTEEQEMALAECETEEIEFLYFVNLEYQRYKFLERLNVDKSDYSVVFGQEPMVPYEEWPDNEQQLDQADEQSFEKSAEESAQEKEGEYESNESSQQPYPGRRNYRDRTNSANSRGFFKKNRFEFCTTTTIQPTETGSTFELSRIEEYRKKEIDQGFLRVLQSEQHISTGASGNNVAKYLFLHGKNQTKFPLRPKRTLQIEFTSVIGTRAKNYERFIRHNLFRYALPEQLYEDLLLSQAKRYNRFEFKTIVAHMVYYCDSLNDHIVKALCNICERERIGYTFVEIAQLLKVNDVRVTPEGLQTITQLWQRFDVINEDMLPFLREYTKKMQIPLRTDFYSAFCRSLIQTKSFNKLETIVVAILQEIRPKPFKLDSSMAGLKGDQVAVLQKEWKVRQQEHYLKLYIELLEVIVKSLDTTVPAYLSELFDEYRKMKPVFNEKELGYAFVCYALKREKIEELLVKLDNEPEKGTSFMYDCLLQTLLSNFEPLEDLSEKMLDVTILKNRVVLTHEQIMKSLTVFKKSSSSNSFSKFLDHCLRFQEDIDKSNDIKREMFYILNNNVEDVSVGGIFNLLDFIFNEKRQKERVEYRAIKLSEEEKARKLLEIQQAVTKNAQTPKEEEKTPAKKEGKKKGKQADKVQDQAAPEEKNVKAEEKPKTQQKVDQEKPSKKEEKKKVKKEKAEERQRQTSLLDQVMAEKQAKSLPQSAELRGNTDQEFVGMIKSQTIRHESKKRKSLQSMSTLFQGSMELTKEEEVPKGKEAKDEKTNPKDAKEDKKKKGKK